VNNLRITPVLAPVAQEIQQILEEIQQSQDSPREKVREAKRKYNKIRGDYDHRKTAAYRATELSKLGYYVKNI